MFRPAREYCASDRPRIEGWDASRWIGERCQYVRFTPGSAVPDKPSGWALEPDGWVCLLVAVSEPLKASATNKPR